MRHVVIEQTLYKITEADYKKLEAKREEIFTEQDYYHGRDIDMIDFIDTLRPKWEKLGFVDFHFCL